VFKFLVYLLITATSLLACTSDFGCGYGQSCVKKPFSTTGVCMKNVNEYGIQQYNSPKSSSNMAPTSGDCDYNTDCPPSFMCHRKYKVCVKR